MEQDPFAQQIEYREGIDADAVCSQCSTVNPEGTLICKTCGNNLRDQRLLRMTADQLLDGDEDATPRASFLARALPVLGLLILLWFGLNAGRMASMLTTGGTVYVDQTADLRPDLFWRGDGASLFDALKQDLLARYPTQMDADDARFEAAPLGDLSEGVYALYERRGASVHFVGAALLSADGDEWVYVGQLDGNIEIRGRATKTDEVLTSFWDEGGALYENEFWALSGVAMLRSDGTIAITGQSEYNSAQFQSVAYRLGSL